MGKISFLSKGKNYEVLLSEDGVIVSSIGNKSFAIFSNDLGEDVFKKVVKKYSGINDSKKIEFLNEYFNELIIQKKRILELEEKLKAFKFSVSLLEAGI